MFEAYKVKVNVNGRWFDSRYDAMPRLKARLLSLLFHIYKQRI